MCSSVLDQNLILVLGTAVWASERRMILKPRVLSASAIRRIRGSLSRNALSDTVQNVLGAGSIQCVLINTTPVSLGPTGRGLKAHAIFLNCSLCRQERPRVPSSRNLPLLPGEQAVSGRYLMHFFARLLTISSKTLRTNFVVDRAVSCAFCGPRRCPAFLHLCIALCPHIRLN